MTVLDLLRPLTSHNAQQRGHDYVSRVRDLRGNASYASASVLGGDVYDVELRADADTLKVFCSCPHFIDQGNACKHLWATALVAREKGFLSDLPRSLAVDFDLDDDDIAAELDDFEFDRSATGRQAARGAWVPQSAVPSVARGVVPAPARPPSPPEWAQTLAALTPRTRELPLSAGPHSRLIYVLAVPFGATLSDVPLTVERQDRKKDGDWSKPRTSGLTLDVIELLPDADDRWALSLMHAASTYPRTDAAYGYGLHALGPSYLRASLIDLLLPRLCPTGRVRLRHVAGPYVGGTSGADDVTLRWDDAPAWRFEVTVASEAAGYRVDARLRRGEEWMDIRDVGLLTDSIAVRGDTASRFDAAGGFWWASQLRQRGPLAVPAAAQRQLVENLARSGIQHLHVPDELRWEERTAPPCFRVTIGAPAPYDGACPIQAEVEYESARASLGGTGHLLSDDGRVVYRRDPIQENAALARLKALGVAGLDPRSRQHATLPDRRVTTLVHVLVAEGWMVEAAGVRYRSIPAPRLRIRSGIDWFELDAVSDASLTTIDIADLLKALAAGRRTVSLGDGTIGMLPEEWLARVAPALSIGEIDEARLRFKPSQVALIDALLAAEPQVDWDEGFVRARRALAQFDGVHPHSPLPSFNGTLRDYQRESLGWMRFLREFGFGGCLADDMGLGKTVMVLAMLDARRGDTTRSARPSLIVLPRSLLFNWANEASRFTPELEVVDFAHAARHSGAEDIAKADLVLTTYGTLRRDIAILKDHRFDYVILDEAQAIKNGATATAKAARLLHGEHRLALTGTPVENHLGELQSLFDFLNPGLLGKSRLLGIAKGSEGGGTDQARRLAKGLRPFFLRRTKEQVAPELPPRTDETLYCELEGEQRTLYDQLREHYRRVLSNLIDRQGLAKSKFQVLEALLRLRQASCHAGLLAPRATGPGRSAPFAAPTAQGSAKFDVLLPRLAELVDEGRKALVFSQFTSLLSLLRQRLDAAGLRYEYLDGDTQDRAAHVARFQEDAAYPLFLISLKAGGVGLNLTAAEYVFLLDPWWNPAVEMQAIDRTHRIGQSKPVFAYRLVARNTVEERILELQSRKRELADAILDAGTSGLRGLQRQDLEQLLT